MKTPLFCCLAALLAAAALAAPVRETADSDSTWVRDLAYEFDDANPEDAGVLTLRLGDDPTPVRYFEIPRSLWDDFRAAPSKGAFYTANIRQRYERVYGIDREERFDSPLPIVTTVNASAAFNEECEPVVIRAISQTRHSIYVAAYAFTRTRIAAALVDAAKRGVRVSLKMDVRQAEHPGAQRILDLFRENGISVALIHTEGDFAAMHNKFMVFDMRGIVTGSYNFTTQAQVVNWENLLWIESDEIAELYKQAWDAIVSD